MEANEIKEAMAFFAIIFNRGDGFWARRWKFFELINNRGDTIIRSHRVRTFQDLEAVMYFRSRVMRLTDHKRTNLCSPQGKDARNTFTNRNFYY